VLLRINVALSVALLICALALVTFTAPRAPTVYAVDQGARDDQTD
jgi:hypothetical protein